MKKHPKLAEKLKLLYKLRLNPNFRTNADIGRELGISKQSISRWIHGSATTLGDRIPHNQVEPMSRIFSVEPIWWTLSLEEFEQEIKNKLAIDKQNEYIKPDDVSVSFLPITSAQVFGREKELKILDQAWRNPQVNVIQLLAFGGVGKSTLVNAWLSALSKENYQGARRVYAWSFYWQGSSSDTKSSGDFFIEHALNWFGDPDPVEGTPWAKAGRLVKLVRASKTLLILDGLEPLQHAPGPKAGQIDNPAVALLVKELAFENTGLCVITSRIGVADIASFENGRVRTKHIDNLSDESAVLLLRTMSVVGSSEDFSKVASVYAGHALSLSLLAGYLTVVHRGSLGKFRELDSLLDDLNQGDHARRLMQAYLDWFDGSTECELLYLVALFDRGVSFSDLKKLCTQYDIDGLTRSLSNLNDAQWLYAVRQLSDSNILIQEQYESALVLDCHPLVRDFIAEKLSAELPDIWVKGNKAIFSFLQSISIDDPQTMIELEPLFRAVIHGTRAGLYEEAFNVYFNKIKKGYSMLMEGSHYADQACIRSFFVENWSVVNSGLSETSKFHLIVSAATNLMSLGRIDEAIEPSYYSLGWFLENHRLFEAVNIAGPLASMLIAAGRLTEAITLLNSLSTVFVRIDNPVLSAVGDNFMAYINYLLGLDIESQLLFEKSDCIITRTNPGCEVSFPTVSSYYCKFLLDTGKTDAALERSLKTVAWREQKTWQVAIDTTSLWASDLLVLGLVFLEKGDLVNAKINLDKQVELLKNADEWLYLPTGLNARAVYFIKIGDFSNAVSDLQEALDIARRTGAKFGQWESYLNFAQLHLARGDKDAAKRFLDKALSIEGMSDYRFRNNEIEDMRRSLAGT